MLGIDLGEVTIGLAISDPTGTVAMPRGSLKRTGRHEDLERLASLCRREEIASIVVGLPLRLDGTPGAQAEKALLFADALRRVTGLPVDTWDERLSSVAATRSLLEADLSRARRRRVVDQTAACMVLQAYLDRQAQKAGRPRLP